MSRMRSRSRLSASQLCSMSARSAGMAAGAACWTFVLVAQGGPERVIQIGMREGVAQVERPCGHGALSLGHDRGHLAVERPERHVRDGEDGRAVEGPAERLRELP